MCSDWALCINVQFLLRKGGIMPWKVFREQGKFCLHKMVNGEKGELVHCHDSAEMARRQQAALYVSENKELEPEDAIIVDEDGTIKGHPLRALYEEKELVSRSLPSPNVDG